jgi:site-specific DNA recombinase
MKVAGYIRVSSESQIDGTSLAAQSKQIKAYCQLKGFDLTVIYSDPGVSGGKPIDKRPEGSKLMANVESGAVMGVVISKLDRGFRNTIDCLQTVDKLDQLSVALHIVDLGGNSIDTQTPAGRFMLTVLVSAVEMEKGLIRDRCNSGRKARRAEGKVIGGLPFGYDLAADSKTLIKNPQEQQALQTIRDMRAAGYTLMMIADTLNKRGYTAKKGGKWDFGKVQSILKRAA